MRNRRISANICKVLDLLQNTEKESQDGLVISVDFEKCFDKIEHVAVYGALKLFGFGPKFIEMVRTTYKDFTVCIQNNGNFSEPFCVERDV